MAVAEARTLRSGRVARGSRSPERRCVGCRTPVARDAALRLARAPDGRVVVDHPARLGGRGAWVHAARVCFERAGRREALSHAFGAPSTADVATLLADALRRVEDRLLGMLSGGRGGRHVVIGTEAVRQAFADGAVALLVVASDARGDRAALEGVAVRLGIPVVETVEKRRLGKLFGRDEVGVVAVTDVGLAAAVAYERSILTGIDAPDAVRPRASR